MKKKSEYHPFVGEPPLIVEAAITLPVSSDSPQRGASALKKNRCILGAMLHVKINGPTLGSPSMLSLMTESVQSWLNKKIRKKLPNRIGTGKEPISGAAER